MIWLAIAVVAALAMAPLALSLWRSGALRSRRDAALDLHRAQLHELDRDLEQARIGVPEHAIARLEIQRRLLAEAEAHTAPAPTGSVIPLLATLLLVPIAAVLLYLPGSAPHMPAVPLATRIAQQRAAAEQAESLIAALTTRIAALDPASDQAREGYTLLGNLQDTRGNLAAAADAWQHALTIRFDPTLAAEVAEAQCRLDGRVSPQSAALFRRALAEAPADAPWRAIAQQRLASAAGAGPRAP